MKTLEFKKKRSTGIGPEWENAENGDAGRNERVPGWGIRLKERRRKGHLYLPNSGTTKKERQVVECAEDEDSDAQEKS